MKLRAAATAGLLLGPAVLFLLAWYAIPVANVLLLSVGYPRWTGAHLVRFFSEPVYLEVLRTTFLMSAIITALCAVIGYPAAYLMASAGARARTWLLIAVVLPFTTSMLVRTYAWMALLGRDGVVNQAMMALGFWGSPAKLMHNTTGVFVGMVHIMAPFMILSIYAVMRNIDLGLCRAAETLGARPLVSHLTVYLPLALPGVVAGSLLVFMLSLGFYITPALLGSPRDIWIAMLVEMQITQVLDWNFGAAIAAVLLVATLVLYVVYIKLFGESRLGQVT
jgi:putative spermidine/putrescine transport system permease protein